MLLSPYQQAILRHIGPKGPRALFLRARAGSGKSFMLREIAQIIPPTGRTFRSGSPVPAAVIAAFSVPIREEMKGKVAHLPHIDVYGIHQMGFRAVRKAYGKDIEVKNSRYWELLILLVNYAVFTCEQPQSGLPKWAYKLFRQAQLGTNLNKIPREQREKVTAAREAARPILRKALVLADRARLALADFRDRTAVLQLAPEVDVTFDPEREEEDLVYTLVYTLLARARDPQTIRQQGTVDYTDMLWLPWVNNLPLAMTYDYVLGDEAQDFSPAQQELIFKAARGGAQFIFVGDEKQAIFGFAGADTKAVAHLIERTKATVLPLPICYRCHSTALDMARFWVPDIEARPGAPRGITEVLKPRSFAHKVKVGDLVLARTNRVLVKELFHLIQAGKPAIIRGRPELTDSLANTASELQIIGTEQIWKGDSVGSAGLSSAVDVLYQRESGRILEANHGDESDPQLDALRDRIEATRTLIENTRCPSLEVFTDRLQELFDTKTDNNGRANVVTLCSAHRAKGLEAERVFILAPEQFPMMRGPRAKGAEESEEDYETWLEEVWEAPDAVARRDEALQQEYNLMYVAVTRPQRELYFVGEARLGDGFGGFCEAAAAAGLLRGRYEEVEDEEEAVEEVEEVATGPKSLPVPSAATPVEPVEPVEPEPLATTDFWKGFKELLGAEKLWRTGQWKAAVYFVRDNHSDWNLLPPEIYTELEQRFGVQAVDPTDTELDAAFEDFQTAWELAHGDPNATEPAIDHAAAQAELEAQADEDLYYFELVLDEKGLLKQVELLWVNGECADVCEIVGREDPQERSAREIQQLATALWGKPDRPFDVDVCTAAWTRGRANGSSVAAEVVTRVETEVAVEVVTNIKPQPPAEFKVEPSPKVEPSVKPVDSPNWSGGQRGAWRELRHFDGQQTLLMYLYRGATIGANPSRVELWNGDAPLDPAADVSGTLIACAELDHKDDIRFRDVWGDTERLNKARGLIRAGLELA